MGDICGDVPAWAGLILAVFGGAIALRSYRLSVRVREQLQARLVYAARGNERWLNDGEVYPSVGDGRGTWIDEALLNRGALGLYVNGPARDVSMDVHNGSDELLPVAFVLLYDVDHDKPVGRWWQVDSAIPPGATRRMTLAFPSNLDPRPFGFRVLLIFRDSSGNWWRRDEADVIRKIRKVPFDRKMYPGVAHIPPPDRATRRAMGTK